MNVDETDVLGGVNRRVIKEEEGVRKTVEEIKMPVERLEESFNEYYSAEKMMSYDEMIAKVRIQLNGDSK